MNPGSLGQETVILWWVLLIAVGLTNIFLWIRQRSRHFADSPWMVRLSGLYVFGCAIRGFFPKADVERYALFDTWLSSVFFGRSIATVAELAFVGQWAILLALLGYRSLGITLLATIGLAECFSWYAVITTHFLGNVIEESLWALTFAVIAVTLWREKWRVLSLSCTVYVGFMLWVDVPMYWTRWMQQREDSVRLRSFMEGLVDLNTRRVVTWSLEHWRPEMPWMTLYFTLAVWMSLWLCGSLFKRASP
jgi:hypothetical protein